MNALLVTQLLTQALAQAQQFNALLVRAHSEGRDVSDTELDGLVANDDSAKARLQALIDAKGE